ncbi:nucleoside hydrolase [Candidatus Bathyarchaeota archaeon]|nr:nucleoside hydrolase [Candidatus Bathyarchaeota archaeon]
MSKTKIIFDGDPGIDDALALLYALKSDDAELVGITTVGGNIGLDKTTRNALRILEITNNSHIPVARGIEKPLLRMNKSEGEVHGKDGLGNSNLPEPKIREIEEHAVDFIIKTIMNNPKQITLVPVGPLTNVAVAVIKEPRLKDYVKEVVIMGGAVTTFGNITPESEFNIYTDPEAAKIVFESGLPITLVGLDVTMKTLLTPNHLEEIMTVSTPVTEFVKKIITHYMRFYQEVVGINGCGMHDPLAIAVAIDKSLVKTRRLFVTVETKGEFTTGETIADLRGSKEGGVRSPNMDVCVEVDSERFMRDFIQLMKK